MDYVLGGRVKKELGPLQRQLSQVGVHELEKSSSWDSYDMVVDCLFGYSFDGVVREEYLQIMDRMLNMRIQRNQMLVSLDVPSGWLVDDHLNDQSQLINKIHPQAVISLTLPKLCLAPFTLTHYLALNLNTAHHHNFYINSTQIKSLF